MSELQDILLNRAKGAVAFFKKQLLSDGSFKNASDLSCYYKSPMMFYCAGETEIANTVLQYIQSNFMQSNGDFKTNASTKSVKPEYEEFWTYTNGWIVRAAQIVGNKKVAELGFNYLEEFKSENTSGYHPNQQSNITDVLSTAHNGLIHLERGNTSFAISAGNYLCTALAAQPIGKDIFYLRFTAEMKPVINFDEQQSLLYCIKKFEPNQLYFMIGYPCAYLGLLYKKTKDKKFLEAAKQYFDFASTCTNICACDFSHKLAWAAAILYSITGEQKYLDFTDKIVKHFLAKQSLQGIWYDDADINTSYDQTAEIACWFFEIAKNILPVKAVSMTS